MEEKECKGDACGYVPTLDRVPTRRKRELERYAELWEKIELPKLMKGGEAK